MIRLVLLLLLATVVPAHAQPATAAATGFDARMATEVYVTALAFMAPRTLEPVPVGQLTTWGLRGLTALDPELSVAVTNDVVVLALRDRIVATLPIPADSAQAWGEAATALAVEARKVSFAVRQAGTEGVLQAFFDELFNHLDPYSRYVGPSDAQDDRDRRTGRAGAGLTLARRGRDVVVTAAIPDGAGADAGIKVGDRILSVDGDPTRGQSADDVLDATEGPEGTTVTIEWRGRDGKVRRADIERATVPPETVTAQRLGNLLLLQVTSFNRRTDDRLASEMERALAGPGPAIKGIVFDLRGNRGGLLRQAVGAADALLPEGIVITTAGRDPDASRVFRSTGGELAYDLPIVILVDGRTASAAEIFAAALADRGRAVVVGSSTLGKGLVQTIAPLPDGGELFVTWSRVLAPRGWPIQGLGVLPQICTSLGEAELSRELRELADGRAPMEAALDRHNRSRAPVPVAEVLAIRSACPASEGREGDLASAKFLMANRKAYETALLPPVGATPLIGARP